MSATVRYRVDFERPERRKKREKAAEVKKKPEVPSGEEPPSRAARQLALAYYIERLIDEGRLASYAEAARILGVTRARMTQVMDLMNLPMEVQEEILTGHRNCSERRFRVPLRPTL